MTEKEFKTRLNVSPHLVPQIGVDLAKEAGAKFDPEPVELPRLGVQYLSHVSGAGYFPSPPDGALGRAFSPAEAEEIARRCNVFRELRRYIEEHGFHPDTRKELLAILDGREP